MTLVRGMSRTQEAEAPKKHKEQQQHKKKKQKKKHKKRKHSKQMQMEVHAMQANAPQRIEVIASSCSMCGSQAVVYDEVVGEQPLQLGECLHCEHRWTQPVGASDAIEVSNPHAPEPSPAISGVRLAPKVPNAA